MHEAHLKEIILKVQKQEIIQKQIKVKSGAGKEEGMIWMRQKADKDALGYVVE